MIDGGCEDFVVENPTALWTGKAFINSVKLLLEEFYGRILRRFMASKW